MITLTLSLVCIRHTRMPCVRSVFGFFCSSLQVLSDYVADDKTLGTFHGPRLQLAGVRAGHAS